MNTNIWLNIGCGKKHISGFVNMDIVQPYDQKLDARKGLPYQDGVVAGVYSEHLFEHLTQAEGLGFLRECRRVLKPGGLVRIAMPDLDVIVDRYGSDDWRGDGDMFKLGFDWVQNRCEMMNIAMREWGHKHVYNQEELIRIASMAGFEVVKRYAYGESDTPSFRNIETRNSSKLIMEFCAPDYRVVDAPLVSILIPAYSAEFFKEAIDSALNQTYQNIEVVVTDDSESGEIETIVKSLAGIGKQINYVRNIEREGGLNNYLKLYSLANGQYIKFLNDDDMLLSTCVERMVNILSSKPSVTLVTSRRQRIDECSQVLKDIPATRPITKFDCELESISCANALSALQANFIGEPSTVMFRKVDLSWVQPHFMSFGGSVAFGAGDVAMWLNLLSRGNAYYISSPLSLFRVHGNQRQNNPDVRERVITTWKNFTLHAQRLGLMRSYLPLYIKYRRGDSKKWKKKSLVLTRIFLSRFKILALKVINRMIVAN